MSTLKHPFKSMRTSQNVLTFKQFSSLCWLHFFWVSISSKDKGLTVFFSEEESMAMLSNLVLCFWYLFLTQNSVKEAQTSFLYRRTLFCLICIYSLSQPIKCCILLHNISIGYSALTLSKPIIFTIIFKSCHVSMFRICDVSEALRIVNFQSLIYSPSS